jgi:hypothetical protein
MGMCESVGVADSAACAAWVQAWGTIAALAVAIGIAAWQGFLARQVQREQVAAIKAQALDRAKYRMKVARCAVHQLLVAAKRTIEAIADTKHEMTRKHCIIVFDEVLGLLAEVPLFDLPDATFATDLISLRQDCRWARQSLVVSPTFDTTGIAAVAADCEVILARLTALEQKG